jgi:hypothetical protein
MAAKIRRTSGNSLHQEILWLATCVLLSKARLFILKVKYPEMYFSSPGTKPENCSQ